MSDSPQLVDRKPFPKNLFTRHDVEAERRQNLLDRAVSSEITEDAQNFILTTVWPSLSSLAGQAPAATPPAASTPALAPVPAPAPKPAPAAVAPASQAAAGPFTTIDSRDEATLRPEYQRLFDACQTQSAHIRDVAQAVARVVAGRARYQRVADRAGGAIPWPFIGIVHLLEGNCSFGRHLHNGDPMSTGPAGNPTWLRTTNVPVDRPAVWPAPAGESDPWIWSALDALRFEGLLKRHDWSVPSMLFLFEKYNGFGYRQFHNPSPYLWSFSQIYRIGKYDRDNHYDPDLVSDQCGCALVLKTLLENLATA